MSSAGAAHEALPREHEVKRGSDRNFGLIVGGMLVVLAFHRIYTGTSSQTTIVVLGSLGLLLIAAAFAAPTLLAPLNRLWFRFGMLLHKVTNPIFLAVIFGLAFVPIGMLMRALGKDLLHLKIDRRASTYWTRRRKPASNFESLRRPF